MRLNDERKKFHKMLQLVLNYTEINLKKNFMGPFYRWGSSASRLEPLQAGSLLFTTKFPEIPATNFIELRRMKD